MKVLGKILLHPLFLIVLVIIALTGAGYSYRLYLKTQSELIELRENPRVSAFEEAQELIEKVGQLVDLPKDETPTVATITDVEKLKDQSFFAKAENGDRVLIYNQIKRAILYRPSANKVIEVAPVNIGETELAQGNQVQGEQVQLEEEQSQEEEIVQTLRMSLYNGTTTNGLTYTIENELREKLTDLEFEVVFRDMAARNDYTKSLVVDLTGNLPKTAQKVADILNGEVGELPAGESEPKGDLLVIVGTE